MHAGMIRANGWLAALLVLSLLQAGNLRPPQATAPVSAAVLADAADGQADLLIVMKDQVDLDQLALDGLSPASKRQAVYQALSETATRSQVALLRALDRNRIAYRSFWITNMVAARGSQELIDQIGRRVDVARIESNQAFRVDLPEPSKDGAPQAPEAVEWGVQKIGAPQVWALGYTGQQIVYAAADTGVQWDHPALKNQYRGWNGISADHNYNWWDSTTGDAFACYMAPCDDHGHGTHVMGTGVGSDGAANRVGVAPGAKWIACRNMKGGVGTPASYIGCLQFFMAPTDLTGTGPNPALGANVVSNSYSCTSSEGCPSALLEDAVNNMRIAGIFMSVSAGNSGPGCDTITDPPGMYDSSISIGATDINDQIAGFSSRGPVGSLIKPDLVAPGVNVRSSYPPNTYQFYSGTSMAAPHVAGAVALLWSARPDLRGDVDSTENLLKDTALPLFSSQCGDAGDALPNNVYGSGRIDVANAMGIHVYYFPWISR